ncbi:MULTISPECIES: hypothetical protein [Micromonospora]|uniref:hypothetical protein n=1 Tax=Micromonospora TaxID=1873 RepID=UPI001374BA5F|nr:MULTISPECIES: hypothetical protein [unclassified Micromonospora]MBM0226095.1 hypothetical protein [Micromonospora sp. ATA51]
MKVLDSRARSSQAKTQVVTMPSKPIDSRPEKGLVEVDVALPDVEVLVDGQLGAGRVDVAQEVKSSRGDSSIHS